MFGNKSDDKTKQPMDIPTLFTLHTAIDCIRYGEKAAAYSKETPDVDVAKVAQLAYHVVMRFEDNFSESFQDEQGNWQTRGRGDKSLVTPLFNRLKNQTDAALAYVDKVFKSGTLTTDMLQSVLNFVQAHGPCPVPEAATVDFRFSEQETGMKEYICFQTNVAIGNCIRTFKNTGYRNYRKAALSASIVDDLVNLKIYEKGKMPVDPTPDVGEIITFATDEVDTMHSAEIEVEETDLYPLQEAQAQLALWWNLFDKASDKRALIDEMVKEAREYLKERQKNPPSAGWVMAS